ncbi:cell division protein FtsZ [Sphingomonas pruni]|uniref:cell division protein FtsZ n=1 Tax=Sphingomonas pruni TaxID=40683 RepID=UPI000AC1E1B8|nr:cell division protein FtsZ [Sphingomonas pruni]
MSFMDTIEMVMPRIAVFGVGGAGGNGVAGLVDENLPNVELVVANTDAQALRMLGVRQQLQLGRMATQGLGAGAWPEVGRAAAQEVMDEIDAALEDVDFCFIAAGMGGGTGTGASPIFAERARLRGIPTIAVVTRPFEFEGLRRASRADQGIATLEPLVDAIIVVPNQRLLGIGDLAMTFKSAMLESNAVLADAVGGIAHLLVTPGLKQIGFAEMRNVIAEMGRAVIGFGEATERTDRAILAAERAMACPLIDDEIAGAGKLMISISGGTDMSLMELDAIVATIADQASPDVELAWGASVSEALDGVVRVALIAQGHRPQIPVQAAPLRAAVAPTAVACSAVAEPKPAALASATIIAVEKPAMVTPLIAAATAAAEAEAEAQVALTPVDDIATPLTKAPTPALPFGTAQASDPRDLTEALVKPTASEAPLLDLIDRLPPAWERMPARSPDDAPPAAVNLKACTMDELWLGDFELEDPRRASLVERIANAVKGLFRSMTLRLGFGRHTMIAYRGTRAPLPA